MGDGWTLFGDGPASFSIIAWRVSIPGHVDKAVIDTRLKGERLKGARINCISCILSIHIHILYCSKIINALKRITIKDTERNVRVKLDKKRSMGIASCPL